MGGIIGQVPFWFGAVSELPAELGGSGDPDMRYFVEKEPEKAVSCLCLIVEDGYNVVSRESAEGIGSKVVDGSRFLPFPDRGNQSAGKKPQVDITPYFGHCELYHLGRKFSVVCPVLQAGGAEGPQSVGL